MNILITILIIIVAVLMVVIGSLFVLGAPNHNEKKRAIWFLLAMLGGMLWSLTSGLQLLFAAQGGAITSWLSYGICFGSLLAGIGLLGYCALTSKVGKGFLVVFTQLSVILMLIPLFNFSLLDSAVHGQANWFYIIYGCLILLIFITTIISVIVEATTKLNRKNRDSTILFLVGLTTTIVIATIFNMVFPFVLHINEFLWIGPLSIYILVLTFYFSLFATHRIALNSNLLKILSYFMIVCSAAILYAIVVAFLVVLIFQDETPAVNIGIFATAISAALLIIVIVVYRLSASIRSLLLVNQIDIAYIIKQINNWPNKPDYKQIAAFLADHLHISYCGLLVDNKLYESHHLGIVEEDLVKIGKMRNAGQSVWQNADLTLSYKLLELNLAGIAQLRTDDGVVIGQILVGKPNEKLGLTRRDFVIFEMIFNLIAERIRLAQKSH